jgi:tryptophan-rich sensory protein
MKNGAKLIVSLILPQMAALSGLLFTETGKGSWYQSIQKPSWNPPGWLFGPVWTALYILMGIAFYLVWKTPAETPGKKKAMTFWIAQLVLNFFWTWVFFGQQEIGWALVEIICLWLLILMTIFAFAKCTRLGAWLLVPYISWVSFATLLNWAIWNLNR